MKSTDKKLEEKMVRYKNLLTVTVKDNNESLVALEKGKILYEYLPKSNDMESILEGKILVRESVYKRLLQAQQQLQITYPSYALFVTYGYRSLEIQTKRFLGQLQKMVQTYFANPIDLYEEVHRFVAVPIVAGHPTGGAIDISIMDTKANVFLDFGTEQYDYATKDCYVFSPHISDKTKENRLLLREVMSLAGFAPFDGEWWHFSYGDREWAWYYKKKNAIYKQIMLKDLRNL